MFYLILWGYEIKTLVYPYKNPKLFNEALPILSMREITRKSKRRTCKVCRKKFFKISQNNLCVRCATEKVEIARLEIKHKEGPIYEKYINNLRKAIL